jgi:hypothetical protein
MADLVAHMAKSVCWADDNTMRRLGSLIIGAKNPLVSDSKALIQPPLHFLQTARAFTSSSLVMRATEGNDGFSVTTRNSSALSCLVNHRAQTCSRVRRPFWQNKHKRIGSV